MERKTTTTPTTEQATESAENTTTTRKVTTISQAREIAEKNRQEQKARKDATEQATRKLHRDDPVKALASCDFRPDRNETPILTTYDYIVTTYDSDGNTDTETRRGEIRFDLLFFAPKANRKDINARFVKIGRKATVLDTRATAKDGAPFVDSVKDIVREIGFPVLADSVNPSVVAHIMNDGRYTTGKGNAQFDERRAKLSLFGFLWATATKHKTTSAYNAEQDRKEQARKAREIEREQARKARKDAKKATAKKATATNAKTTPAK